MRFQDSNKKLFPGKTTFKRTAGERTSGKRTLVSTPLRLHMLSWLCYGLVRFMTGMTGDAPGKNLGHM
jgi:hypothetical protein